MTLTQALALGALQGATEFLPISSSGHLALAQAALAISGAPLLLFDVVVHLGTLTAIAVLLRRRIIGLVRAAASFRPGATPPPPGSGLAVDRRWLALIALGSVPTAVLGLLLRGPAEAWLERPTVVGVALVVTAGVLVVSERVGHRSRPAGELGVLDALVVGTAQGLAVIPGISRSGATVAAALARDARPDVAVELSLLLSMPAVLGAALLVGVQSGARVTASDVAPLCVGFATALVTGVAAVKALQWAVSSRRLLWFASYCAVLGGGAIVLG